MKNNKVFRQLIQRLNHKTHQGEFPLTPQTSCCLTLQKWIAQILRITRSKVSHRYATTGINNLPNQKRQYMDFQKSMYYTEYLFLKTDPMEDHVDMSVTEYSEENNEIYKIELEKMTNTILSTINFKNFEDLKQRKIFPTRIQYLKTLGEHIFRLANQVEYQWSSFSDLEQQTLIEIAYKIIEPPPFNLKTKFQIVLSEFFLKITGNLKNLRFCLDALEQLADNILNKVEQNDPNYQLAISNMLEEALEEIEQNPEMIQIVTSENIDEILQQLSDRAYGDF